MSLNNTPLKFSNKTEFIPAKPITTKMSCKNTTDRLDVAEKELRSALASVTETGSPDNLRKLLTLIEDVVEVKSSFSHNHGLTYSTDFSIGDADGGISHPLTNDYTQMYDSEGVVNFDIDTNVAAGTVNVPDNIPGAEGTDVITFT